MFFVAFCCCGLATWGSPTPAQLLLGSRAPSLACLRRTPSALPLTRGSFPNLVLLGFATTSSKGAQPRMAALHDGSGQYDDTVGIQLEKVISVDHAHPAHSHTCRVAAIMFSLRAWLRYDFPDIDDAKLARQAEIRRWWSLSAMVTSLCQITSQKSLEATEH